jgi:FHS family L-fucose permease-like MFS transporter
MSQQSKSDANEHVNPHGGVDPDFDHSESAKRLSTVSQQTNWGQFGVLISVFFFWGFVAASNSIFIPFCKRYFDLDQIQSQLIGSAFYGAYFYGSLLLYFISYITGTDLLNRIGYKKGIIYGLLISVIGALALAFISGSDEPTFPMILLSFFIIALGFSLQQTAAQPFANSLGSPETGAHRLNMAGGVNSFGTLLGPVIVSFLLFGALASTAEADISSIQTLYFFLAGLFVFAAIVFAFAKLPMTTINEKLEKSPKALYTLLAIGVIFLPVLFADAINESLDIPKSYIIIASLVLILGILFVSMGVARKNPSGWGAMAYPQLVLGMIAIFVYVGVEVTVDNNFGALLKRPEFGGYDESENSHLIALYWGSLMIGRWTAAISVFNLARQTKKLMTIIVPFIAFGIIVLVNWLKDSPNDDFNPIDDYKYYPIFILLLIGANLYAQERPIKLLATVSILGAALMILSLATEGMVSNYAIIATGLCCSVMWPCIFSLAIAGLGKYTTQGSAFLITMILGGAIIPPSQGAIIDLDKGSEVNGITTGPYTHLSYIVPVVCFAYLAWHALKSRQVLKAQGLDFDKQVSGGH